MKINPRYLFIAALGSLLGLSGCSQSPVEAQSADAPAPAKVSVATGSDHVATVTLTPQAEERLAIDLGAVERKVVARTKTFGGEVVLPPDRLVIVSAPLPGRISGPESGPVPTVGAQLRQGQPILRLTPLMAPQQDLRLQTEKEITSLQAHLQVVEARERRTRQLYQDRAGSARAHEEAQEELAVTRANMVAAQERLKRLQQAPLEADYSLAVTSPRDGILQRIHVVAGQVIPASAPILEVISLATVWIRVPVSTSDRPLLNRTAAASVHGLAEDPATDSFRATPVTAPPTADPATATIDLYYEMSNPNGRLIPGEKVGVTISLGDEYESLTVPHASVLRDEQGGAWVYVSAGAGVYRRHRVIINYVSGPEAVLSEGPPVDSKVVTSGATELFGTEFSAGH